jgi:outer membrane protein assembly factor BamD (BamD/ComL family)
VQFAIAIADQQWELAVKTGDQIALEYPNSRMAREVREKMELLKQYAANANSAVN